MISRFQFLLLTFSLMVLFNLWGASTRLEAAAYGTKIINGSDWLGGQGVDVYSNGSVSTDFEDYSPPAVGMKWQCVELPQRLYQARGWHNGKFPVSYAYQIYDVAGSMGMEAHANGSGYVPVPGDMIVMSYDNTAGHVSVVDHVDANTVYVNEQNWDNNTGHGTYNRSGNNGSSLSRSGTAYSVRGTVHSPNNQSSSINRYPGTNPALSDIKNMLIAAGQKYKIPPHILFGIAFQESGWREYGSDGKTLVSGDGGIGIMQLTGATAAQFDVNRLASDIAYNIDCGAKVVIDKWNISPIIGDGVGNSGREKLENWYYTIWYYNSGGNVNNPNLHSNCYQDLSSTTSALTHLGYGKVSASPSRPCRQLVYQNITYLLLHHLFIPIGTSSA